MLDGGPPDLPEVTIDHSWAFHHRGDSSTVTLEDLKHAVDEGTLPGERTLRIEIYNYDWGASGPWDFLVEVAVEYGFAKAIELLSRWLSDRFARPSGLGDLENAAKTAANHLRKYHNVENPILEASRAAGERWELEFRDEHMRSWSITVTGEFTLVVVADRLEPG